MTKPSDTHASDPLERHLVKKLEGFLDGATVRPGDPRMATVTMFQRRGLLSAKPDKDAQGVHLWVSVTDAGQAALNLALTR